MKKIANVPKRTGGDFFDKVIAFCVRRKHSYEAKFFDKIEDANIETNTEVTGNKIENINIDSPKKYFLGFEKPVHKFST